MKDTAYDRHDVFHRGFECVIRHALLELKSNEIGFINTRTEYEKRA